MLWFGLALCSLRIEDMKRFLSDYPELSELAGRLEKHMMVVQQCSQIISERHLMIVSEVEQELACKDDHSAAVDVSRMNCNLLLEMNAPQCICMHLRRSMSAVC